MTEGRLDSYVRKLIEQEEAMGKLYETYGAFFPDHARLWNTLSQQEALHAKVLRRLHTAMVTGGVTFSPANLHGEDIDRTLEFVNVCVSDCTNGRTDMAAALKAAIFLETSLIENRLFECFDSMTPSIEKDLSTIRLQTVGHLKQVESYPAG